MEYNFVDWYNELPERVSGILKTGIRSIKNKILAGTDEQRALAHRWAVALRSGDYIQGNGMLKIVIPNPSWEEPIVKYCCMGVLCDIVKPDSWHITLWQFDYATHEDYPPEQVMMMLNLSQLDAGFLATGNDTYEWTFAIIADIVDPKVLLP